MNEKGHCKNCGDQIGDDAIPMSSVQTNVE
jgi:hypothetical protein